MNYTINSADNRGNVNITLSFANLNGETMEFTQDLCNLPVNDQTQLQTALADYVRDYEAQYNYVEPIPAAIATLVDQTIEVS